jgi:hypothetical protein
LALCLAGVAPAGASAEGDAPPVSPSEQARIVQGTLNAVRKMIRANPQQKPDPGQVFLNKLNTGLGFGSDLSTVLSGGSPELLFPHLNKATDAAGYFGLWYATAEMFKALAEEKRGAGTKVLAALQAYLSWGLGKMGAGGSLMAAGANLPLVALNQMGSTLQATAVARWWDTYETWQFRHAWKGRDYLGLVRAHGWRGMFQKMDEFWHSKAFELKSEYLVRAKHPQLEMHLRNRFLHAHVFPALAEQAEDQLLTARVKARMAMERSLERAGLRFTVVIADETGAAVPEARRSFAPFQVAEVEDGKKYHLFLPLRRMLAQEGRGRSYALEAWLPGGAQRQRVEFTLPELLSAAGRARRSYTATAVHVFRFEVWSLRLEPAQVRLQPGQERTIRAVVSNAVRPGASLPEHLRTEVDWTVAPDIVPYRWGAHRSLTVGYPRRPPAQVRSAMVRAVIYGQGTEVFLQATAKVLVLPRELETTAGQDERLRKLCRRHAARTAAQGRRNQDMDCGRLGRVWSADQEELFKACLEDRPTATELEAGFAHRRRVLEQCRQARAEEQRLAQQLCRLLARRALRQQAVNQVLDCGLSGPLWTENAQAFFRQCMQPDVSQSELQAKLDVNKQALAQCRRAKEREAEQPGDKRAEQADQPRGPAVWEGTWHRTGKQVTPDYTVHIDDAISISVKDGKASIYNHTSGNRTEGTASGGAINWRREDSIGVEEGSYVLDEDGERFTGSSKGYYKSAGGGTWVGSFKGVRQ